MTNLDDLTIGEAKELSALLAGKQSATHSFEVGKQYLIRTVTMHHLGKLERITDSDLVLSSASWLADSGRFSAALEQGCVSEVEPFLDPVLISRAAIVDATEWRHPLPTEAK